MPPCASSMPRGGCIIGTRMIAASFLVKDLRIDWRAGERYFINRLIDGDLAANNGGWQWAASTGTDAALIFVYLIRPPGEKFDKGGRLFGNGCLSWQMSLIRRCISRGFGPINRG